MAFTIPDYKTGNQGTPAERAATTEAALRAVVRQFGAVPFNPDTCVRDYPWPAGTTEDDMIALEVLMEDAFQGLGDRVYGIAADEQARA